MRRGPKYGGRSKCVRNNNMANDDDTMTAMPLPRKPKTFMDYLLQLEQKKASVKEHALSSIISILNEGKECDILEKNSATCLYHILGLIERGSAKEKQLASQVLGLMAMTLSGTDNVQEIFNETVPVLTEVLTTKVKDPWALITLLYSLAMVTFFCANNPVETQATMQIIWKFILPESKLDVSAQNQVPIIISAAISAWSFLITTIDGFELSYHWQGAIPLFLNMVESDDDSVCVAVAEALAVIFESDNINKFFKAKSALNYSELKKQIKDIVLRRLEKVSKAKSEISLKQTFCNAARDDWDVLKYFKDDIFPQTSERINGNKLTLSSWSSMIQFKFTRNFTGEEEFSKHMLENELFHDLFKFTPNYEKNDIACLYESTMVKIEPSVYLPEELDPELRTCKQKKQERQLRRTIIDKSKTKVLNKKRTNAEERKGKMYEVESEL